MNVIPELLREQREEVGLSQRAVARALGVSPQTYVWWERGAVLPKATAAGSLADWLGLSKAEVLIALGVLEPDETIVRVGASGLPQGSTDPATIWAGRAVSSSGRAPDF